jgi:hypothetical protein
MDNWPEDLLSAMGTLARDVEKTVSTLVTEVDQAVDRAVDQLIDATQTAVEQLNLDFETEIDPYLNRFFDPWVDQLIELFGGMETELESRARPFTNTVNPMMNNHPACVGCSNYHGYSYGGEMLVCGMHPFGWEGEQCPDWESSWPQNGPDANG